MEKVAPYLTVDGNAYPAVVDGRVKWIVDGYTTSQYYPYSQQEQLSDATADTQTTSGRAVALPNSTVNYIRNSVKATVDAYDGSVTLYAWDDQDPLLKSWQKVFPTSLKPFSEMSGDVMSHVRYPEDLFKVQRQLLGQLPRDGPVQLLQDQRCLERARRPHGGYGRQAAAVLHVAADAGPGQAGLPADVLLHPADRQRQCP